MATQVKRRFVLADKAALTDFERGIRSLVEAGHGARAIAVLHETAVANGLETLAEACNPKELMPTISGWDDVIGGCVEAAANIQEELRLVLRLGVYSKSQGSLSGTPDDQQGIIKWVIERVESGSADGLPKGRYDTSCRMTGVEPLYAMLREEPDNDYRNAPQSHLCGWAIAATWAGVMDRIIKDSPPPEGFTIRIENDRVSWPMEEGYYDLLPSFTREWPPTNALAPNAAEQIAAERKAENQKRFQETWIKIVAETREIHRICRYFPFYRFRSRGRLAANWEDNFKMTCSAVSLDPTPDISWKMSAGELTDILRRVLEAKGVRDVEDALDPAHTDALHESWLATARKKDFKFEPALTLFSLHLAWAIKIGGPFVQDRWEHAKPYAEEMKL